MLQGDRLRDVDREKFRLASGPRGGGNRIGGDLAVHRTDRQEGIEGLVVRHFFGLVGAELRNRDLVGRDAGFGQDHAQQRGICRRLADHADPVALELVDGLDFRRGFPFRSFARKTGR
jgi:hypothetical protein